MADSTTFSSKSNAKRAAEKAMANGTSPSIDYRLRSREDDRIEIVWVRNDCIHGTREVPTTEQIEDEIVSAIDEVEKESIPEPSVDAMGKPERKPRAAPSGHRKPSKSAELDAAASRGEMPAKPIMTSPTNMAQYQPRFDKLEAMAKAADWDGVRAYEVKGINNYAKMVKQYRERLLAAHAASASAEAA